MNKTSAVLIAGIASCGALAKTIDKWDGTASWDAAEACFALTLLGQLW